jgi:uncharacterized membrane protein YphA (DoxX/SURF4 family)
MTRIERLFYWIRACPLCYRVTLFTRILLAAAFIPTGMVKLLGERFTLLGTDTPIGAFFEAMYQTGLYWRFLGLGQVVAGVLLLFPRLAHLGAAIFLPIMLNIFVLTVSLSFGGTPFVTGALVLAVTCLCFWDGHRFRPLLTLAPLSRPVPVQRLDTWETVGFVAFAASILGFFGMTRSLVDAGFALVFVATGLAAGGFTLCRFLCAWWRQRADRLRDGVDVPATG